MRDWMDDQWQAFADSLYEAAWDTGGWSGALQQLTDLFGCAEGCYIRQQTGRTPVFSALASTWHDAEYLRLYDEIRELNPYVEVLADLPVGHVLTDGLSDVLQNPQARTFHQLWYVPRGLHSTLVLKVPGPVDNPGYICLDRGVHQRPFDEHDIDLARRIAPDLVRATRLHLRIAESRWQQHTRPADEGVGCLVLDGAQHHVLRANERALDLLAGSDAPLALRATRGDVALGRLHAPTSKAQDALARLVDSALLAGGGGGECVLRGQGEGPGWHVQVTPIVRPLDWGLGLHRAVCLMLRPLQACATANADRLQMLFGLSRKEAAVAASLAAGVPLKQVAERLGIGLSTARTHLAHVFDKTGLRSQSALITLVAGGLGGGPPMAQQQGNWKDDVGCEPFPLLPS